MTITLTYFSGAITRTTGGQEWTGEWDELEGYLRAHTVDAPAKDQSGYFVAAPCAGGVRNDAAAQPTRVIALDWDLDGTAPDWAALAEYDYVAHTTGSHLKVCKENPTGAPRWRVWLHVAEASAEVVRAARSPWAGAARRAISQPAFVPTTGDRTEWRTNPDPGWDPVNLIEWSARAPEATLAAPYVRPATVTRPSKASTNALAARWHTDPTETNYLAGAVGAVLGGAWEWSDEAITEYFRVWLTHPDPRHLASALRAAVTRRAGGVTKGFPELEKYIGQPFAADTTTEQDVSTLILASPGGPPPDAELRAAMGGTWVQGRGLVDIVAPPKWLVKKLGLAPGRYTGLSGFASAGKTWLAQGLALSVATGRDFCGLEVRQGSVLHIDHEQGVDMTRERYQLLGTTATEQLAFVSFPRWRLSGEGGKMLLTQLARNRALIIIDSLRASVGGDENSSEVRQWLDGASEVSDATGCTILVLHHAKKGTDGVDDIYKARGSGGIVDAAGSFWHLDLQDRDDAGARGPSMLSQTKPGRHPPGGVIPPTAFVITAEPDGRVSLSLSNELAVDSPDVRAEDSIVEALQSRTHRFASVEELRASAGIKKPVFNSALARLKARGAVDKVDGFYTLV